MLASTSCIRPRPEARVLPSLAPLPKPFEATLPMMAVARPVRSDGQTDFYEITARAAKAQILPGLDTTIWGYDGIFPGPLFEARRGRRVSLKLRNALDVPIVNHLHGGRTAPEYDGYPTDLILPAAGFPESHMHDPLARIATGEREYIYENNQRAATLWYHDHRMDHTAPQVWRGLAGMYILRDPAEDELPLPRAGREIPLLICDRSFEADGSFRYPSPNTEYMGGVLGDVILVNGAPWPRFEVANVKYRFRILNASNARRYELALDPLGSFIQIGSDGGLLSAPITHQKVRIAPAERFDVIIDFSKFPIGSQVRLMNRRDPVMRFDVVRTERDDITIPSTLSDAQRAVDIIPMFRDFDFSFNRSQHGWRINGKPFDPSRMDARPKLDAVEIWRLKTDFSHPLHLHLVHFQVLSHSGRPGPYDAGWKDTIDLAAGETASILVQFTGYRGRYVFHCHNLEHEDMAMMANFEVV